MAYFSTRATLEHAPLDVYVLGMAVHPPSWSLTEKRLEELVFDTAHAALKDAGVRRAEIDHLTIAASDELDGRAISSMLLAAPAGGQLRDEIKCTDSGLTGLCLGAMRVASGVVDIGLVASWSKTSEAPVENVMRMRAEPFYTRPVGLNMAIADGLFAGAVGERYGFGADDADARTLANFAQAQRNPRGLRSPGPTPRELDASEYVAAPLRQAHRAPISDGAVAMVIASGRWLEGAGGRRPKARIAGLGWRSERFDLDAERLAGLAAFEGAVAQALRASGGRSLADLDVVELDAQTAYHDLAYRRALGDWQGSVSPGGGAFAQNPYFCTGLVNAAEAVLQVSNAAAAVQVPGARRALAHGAHGFAQQGHVAVVLEGV